jgi:hypothetical protein
MPYVVAARCAVIAAVALTVNGRLEGGGGEKELLGFGGQGPQMSQTISSRAPPPPPPPLAPPPPPAPFYPFRNTSLPIAERVADLVGRLTLAEKVAQMTRGGAASNSPAPGIERLGVDPHIWGWLQAALPLGASPLNSHVPVDGCCGECSQCSVCVHDPHIWGWLQIDPLDAPLNSHSGCCGQCTQWQSVQRNPARVAAVEAHKHVGLRLLARIYTLSCLTLALVHDDSAPIFPTASTLTSATPPLHAQAHTQRRIIARPMQLTNACSFFQAPSAHQG